MEQAVAEALHRVSAAEHGRGSADRRQRVDAVRQRHGQVVDGEEVDVELLEGEAVGEGLERPGPVDGFVEPLELLDEPLAERR